MRPHPRIRKTIKNGGAALTVLLVAVWIGSGWLTAGVSGTGGYIAVFDGRACICRVKPASMLPLHWVVSFDGDAYFNWWFVYYQRPGCWEVRIPIWPLATLCFLMSALAFRLDTLARRRENMHLCPKCHYDRTGLAADAVCPECGTNGPALPKTG